MNTTFRMEKIVVRESPDGIGIHIENYGDPTYITVWQAEEVAGAIENVAAKVIERIGKVQAAAREDK